MTTLVYIKHFRRVESARVFCLQKLLSCCVVTKYSVPKQEIVG